MGLIKAAAGAGGGVLADQWKEYFYCDAINADVLAVKGRKKVTKRSSNTKGDEDIIHKRFGHRGGGRTGDDDRRSGQGRGSRIRARVEFVYDFVRRADYFRRFVW
mgnify:CR=1 FL=1